MGRSRENSRKNLKKFPRTQFLPVLKPEKLFFFKLRRRKIFWQVFLEKA